MTAGLTFATLGLIFILWAHDGKFEIVSDSKILRVMSVKLLAHGCMHLIQGLTVWGDG
jgi:hypothetical protein